MTTIYKALVLDFGGVISRTLFETHELTEKALGLARGTLTWLGPFAPATDPLWQDMQARKITERDYWLQRARETGKLAGKSWTRMDEFVQAARGADPDAIIRPEFRDALEIADRAGITCAILSNELDLFYGANFRHKLHFLSRFAVIIDATYSNTLKPDVRAYLAASDALLVSPKECVFVDDQMKNIEGAVAAGMTAVHFDVKNPHQSYRQALSYFGLDLQEKAA